MRLCGCAVVDMVNRCLRVCLAAKIFAARGVVFTLPPIPKRLPSPDEPGLGYDPRGTLRYHDTEVFVEDCFLPDGAVVQFPPRDPAYLAFAARVAAGVPVAPAAAGTAAVGGGSGGLGFDQDVMM